jgi:hypothetical protein
MLQALQPLAQSQSLTLLGRQNDARHSADSESKSHQASTKPASAFVTQLLATKHAADAYRQKRRCSPYEAKLAYVAGSGLLHRDSSATQINVAA